MLRFSDSLFCLLLTLTTVFLDIPRKGFVIGMKKENLTEYKLVKKKEERESASTKLIIKVIIVDFCYQVEYEILTGYQLLLWSRI